MPRQTVRGSTSRVQVASSDQISSFQVVAPTNVRAEDTVSLQANALSNALGLGSDLAVDATERMQQKQYEQGVEDQALGKVDQKKLEKRTAYRKAVTEMNTRADWIQDKSEFNAFIKTQDIQTPEQLDDVLHQLFQSKYEGIDDPWTAKTIAPELLKYKADKHSELIERHNVEILENNVANLQITARDDYVNGRLDVLKLNGDIVELMGGEAANEIMFSLLKDLAIDSGDSSLLTEVPAKINGAATFNSLPAYNEKVNNAIMRADNTEIARGTAEAKATKALLEEAQDEVGKRIFHAITAKKDPGALIDEFLELGGDPNKALSYQKSFFTVRDDIEEHDGDLAATATLETQIYMGNADISDISDAFKEGTIGSGLQGTKNLSRLLSTHDKAQRGLKGQRDPMTTKYADNIKGKFDPGTGIFKDPLGAGMQRDAVLEYYKLVNEDGTSPAEAHSQVVGKWSEVWDGIMQDNETSVNETSQFVNFAKGKSTINELMATGIISSDIDAIVRNAEELGLSTGEILDAVSQIRAAAEGE